MKNLGTKIEFIAAPIARGIDAIAGTNINGCGGCEKMRDNLNAGMSLTDAIYQRWFAVKQQGGKMKYQVAVVIEADKLTEAAQKAESIGEVLSIQARPEPRPPITGQPTRPQ